MPPDPTVLALLEAGVAAAPENSALRLHLASFLIEAGDPERALEQAAAVLARQPADVPALRVAARAATLAGDGERAAGYQRLLVALGTHHAEVDETSTPARAGGGASVAPSAAEAGVEPPAYRSDEDHRAASEPDPDAAGAVDEVERMLRLRDDEAAEGNDAGRLLDVERPTVTLADVGGMEQVKRRLEIAFLGPLRNPELRRVYAKDLRGGMLLYGPPGCGKSFLARALAGEIGARFASVGLADVLDMWLGQSERNLHEIFETARRNAPCVLFLDEVDALGQKRSQLRHSAGRGVVNQLLAELDSVGSDNTGLFVLAATNHPWDVDVALRRPGRFDRTLLVLPPDAPAREAILALHLRERPVTGDLDLRRVAKHTEGYSGADLAHVCDTAAELALEESLTSGAVRPIGETHLARALREVHASTRGWFSVARNYAMFANDGGAYDDLLEYVRAHKLG